MGPGSRHRPLMPNNPNEQGRQDRRAEDDPERRFRQIAAGRHSRELTGKKFEIAFDQGEVGSRLIGLSQREDVFIWHMHVMAERGYRGVKPLTGCSIRRSCRDGASNAIAHRREPPRKTRPCGLRSYTGRFC